MTQEKLSVRKIREVLRLKHEVGLSNRAIARACRVSNSTVGEYVKRARKAGLGWPLPSELGEEDLYRKMFPEREETKLAERPQPDWEAVHRELAPFAGLRYSSRYFIFCNFSDQLQGFLCFFFIHQTDRKADMDQRIISHIGLGRIFKAGFLYDSAEVNSCHAKRIFLIDVCYFSGNAETHM